MSRLRLTSIFLTVWVLHVDCNYDEGAKIEISDGNLCLEPGKGKNIYLRTNGPQSTIFLGDTSLSNVTSRGNAERPYDEDKEENNPNDVLERLQALESLHFVSQTGFIMNVSLQTVRINVMSYRLRRLQYLFDSWRENKCKVHTCQNGGTCLNLIRDFYCLCPSNWEGLNCEIDVNECRNFAGTDLGCQNGADCINKPGSYECHCKTGWYGTHCTRRKMDCSAGKFEMCGHGTCVPVNSGEGIKCICDQGWTTNGSEVCLTDVNECDSSLGSRCSTNPKVECINLPGSFRCGQCPNGFQGDGYVCYDIDECMTSNGGCSSLVSCHNTIGSRICGACPFGYMGDGVTCTWKGFCSIDHGGCHPSARCIENPSAGRGVHCECPQGMDGDGDGLHGCYVSTNNGTKSCEDDPCGPHGRCHILRIGYTCICLRGFTGSHCDVRAKGCETNPCKNGGICREDDTMEKGFRCECTTRFTGTLCQEHSRCGSILRAEEGNFMYPLTNTTYESKSKCAWVIRTIPEKVINVTFTRFNLERTPDCTFDFLQIHDGRNTADPLIGKFCGDDAPMGGHILSNQHNLYLWFLSNGANGQGFALHWNSVKPVCGGEVNATVHGAISSPGSPGKYPPNRDCYWHLTTSLSKRIQLHFFQLDFEPHPNCSFDYLAVYDGSQTTDQLIEKYCNSTQPAPLQSSGPEMTIHFHSDAHSSGKGFQITYAPVEGVPGCGGIFSGDRGEVSSPSFEGSNWSDLTCEYSIKTGPDTQIQIDFELFTHSVRNCNSNYLKIYDGSSRDSPIIVHMCGILGNKPTLYSTSNNVFMVFRSDAFRSGQRFKILYKVICKHFTSGDSGVIKSPMYPFTYPANRICEYIIETSIGKAIQLTFQDFDIEGYKQNNCTFDNVKVRDGINNNSTLLGEFCGRKIPPTQISTHNIMYVSFKSDMSQAGSGFYANFTTVDIECGGIYRSATGTITYPSGDGRYKNTQKCTWIIVAPEGKFIHLNWNWFELEYSGRCTADYLEVSLIGDGHEEPRKFCGKKIPPKMTMPSNSLKLKFESDISVQAQGFSVTYSFIKDIGHCGGNYIQNHGVIYAPDWPYWPSGPMDCIWTISVIAGQQIKLNISKCDLGPLEYLRIYNGPSIFSPLLDEYTGKFTWKSVTSVANTVYIHYHHDFVFSRILDISLKIEWDSTTIGCGGTFTGVEGFISSPNYPLNYEGNYECFYRIVTNQGSRISLKFLLFDLENNIQCDDHVEIFDGRDPESQLLGRFCTNLPKQIIETKSNYAFIKFKSDFAIGGKGFLLTYNAICNNTVTGYYGVIESLGYPNNYPTNVNCTWLIRAPKGNKIHVTFTDFNIRFKKMHWLRSRIICDSDYLMINELSQIESTTRLCGSRLPTQFRTSGNLLNISFYTDQENPLYPEVYSGFKLEWLSYGCREHIKKNSGNLNKILSSIDPMECEWLIEVPDGRGIKLTFTKVYMLETNNCTTDGLEVYNGPTEDFPLLTKFCHIVDTASVTSSSNSLLVKLIKNSSLKDVHFTSSFNHVDPFCGGKLNTQSGTVTSKNYPNNYDNNLDCTWTMVAPRGYRVTLEFTKIDLNNDRNECTDYLKLYDDIDVSKNYTHLICNSSAPKYYISKRNILVVRFVTNNVGTAKGFKADYSSTCGGVIPLTENSVDGVITNDNYKSHSNNSCVWTIFAPEFEQKVSLTITHLSLPINYVHRTNQTCPNSYIKILDGNDETAPLIDEYCGNKVPATIVSRGSAITIILGTHDDKISGVFSAFYSAVANACGATLTSENGVIASPNYPNPYPINTVCEWILKTSPGNKVSINIEMLDISYSEECNEDYLEIREDYGAGRILGLYCGSVLPINATSASKLYVKFHSDNKSPGQGFLINYSFLHGNDIIGMENGEIASPLYPRYYDGSGEFWWRVTSGNEGINIEIDKLQINTEGELCKDSLSIYDGYDDEAPLLKELCGALNKKAEVIRTTTNVVYIKLKLDEANSAAFFHLQWSQGNRDIDLISDKFNCGNNSTINVSADAPVNFSSPNYPQNYGLDQKCEWVFRARYGRHISIKFIDFDIEEREPCTNGDTVSIFEANVPAEWKPVKENICLNSEVQQIFNGNTYMKIVFRSDQSFTKRGFMAQVSSLCGTTFTEPVGFIDSNENETVRLPVRCEWKVKVRPGRRIQLFLSILNIRNEKNDCQTYIVFRNGASSESPFLSDGKYCGYAHENLTSVITTGNNLYVSYVKAKNKYNQRFSIYYQEVDANCGVTSALNRDHSWELINTPNYPNVPDGYTECNWILTGPIGEILRLEFIGRFDIYQEDNCVSEFVEVHDGLSESSPLIGRFCGKSPGTIKTSGNTIYIKYLTDRPEPNNGFKANISIDICGGTIKANNGELKSPGYPNIIHLPQNTVCIWHIIGSEGHSLSITPHDINLPESQTACGTNVTVEEIEPVNNTKDVLKTYCYPSAVDISDIQTSGNRATVILYIGAPSEFNVGVRRTSFRFTFRSSIPSCQEEITTPDGFLTTPRYPRGSNLKYCRWTIEIPDQSRRINLEVIDSGNNFIMINEARYEQTIAKIDHYDISTDNTTFKSSGNTMCIYVLAPKEGPFRFKARFTSYEHALCGGTLRGITGRLTSSDIHNAYVCKWNFLGYDEGVTSYQYKSIFFTGTVNSSSSFCSDYLDTKLTLKSFMEKKLICQSELSYIIPNTHFELKASKELRENLFFDLQWKLQPCGGVVHVHENSRNIMNIPQLYNDTIKCAWVLKNDHYDPIEIKLEGKFHLNCGDEILKIGQLISSTRLYIFDDCKDMLQHPNVIHFTNIFIEYHSKIQNPNLKIFVKTVTPQCGGLVRNPGKFTSPNFPKDYDSNLECEWEIQTKLGFSISLHFVNRFAIEKSPNCTKDSVIIYDWKDDNYIEVARLCGRDLPSVFNSSFDRLKVVLRTDAETNLDGFEASWENACGGVYNATTKKQYLYSPGYPYFPTLYTCTYKISAPSNNLQIKFLDFDMTGDPGDCGNDNITISYAFDNIFSISTYCGNEIPVINGIFREIKIVYNSVDMTVKRGFKMAYSLYSCGGYITQPTTIFSGSQEKYDNNMNCTWLIEAPKNKKVVLKVVYFELEQSYDCNADHLDVYEGPKIDEDMRLAVFCGDVPSSTVIHSKGTTLTLVFITDAFMEVKGFKFDIMFSYSETVGCGGDINVTTSYNLTSPHINSKYTYENFLDCHWNILAPVDHNIKVSFLSFQIAPCLNINETVVGFSKCDCDFLLIKDGLNPDSLDIGTYCGHTFPPELVSSSNTMSMRLSTDGEITSTGFTVNLAVQESVCGPSLFNISGSLRVKSPDYDTGSIPRGIHCVYHFVAPSSNELIHVHFKDLDLKPGTTNTVCDKDKIVITREALPIGVRLGKDYIHGGYRPTLLGFSVFTFYSVITNATTPDRYVICGHRKSIDVYVTGSFDMNVITSSDEIAHEYKGIDIEVSILGFCGRNFTELYGRVVNYKKYNNSIDCSTLIAVPDNYTISLYLNTNVKVYWHTRSLLTIYDGNTTTSGKINSFGQGMTDFSMNPIFSTGKYILLHNHIIEDYIITYDFTYLATDKGRGCGGFFYGDQGTVTSPLYPSVYRETKTCQWELETHHGTRISLVFDSFEMGRDCDHNYVQLVDRFGTVLSNYCEDRPADFTSVDNYVKIVFVTNRNNGGTGWVAKFFSVL